MKARRTVLLVICVAIAVLMTANAALWLVMPARAAEALRMPLLTGPALSSQMDIGAFFLATAGFTVTALYTRERPWFIAAATLLLGAAAYRTAAFAFHGAPFLAGMVGIEVAMGIILVIASRQLSPRPASNG
jgi:hypothetical protein